MQKWMTGSMCAAAMFSLAVAASAQTYPQTSGQQPTTRSAPASSGSQTGTTRDSSRQTASSKRADSSAQRITVTGCVMQGSGATPTASASGSSGNAGGWMLSNATMSNNADSQTAVNGGYGNQTSQTSRSGSPSNEGTSAGNRNGATRTGVSGSTSTATGTSGATAAGSPDTEAHGAGVGATDRAGSTVGGGATAGATAGSTSRSSSAASTAQNRQGADSSQTSGTPGGYAVSGATSYQLTGLTNPMEYANKKVEMSGTIVETRARTTRRNSNATAGATTTPTLRVTSVHVLGGTCQ